MKKITGEKLSQCRELEQNIFEILADEMPDELTERHIRYEYCNSISYGGQCRTWGDTNALIRISEMYEWSMDIVAHEIIHALLPPHAHHGLIFKQAMEYVNNILNLHVTTRMTKAQIDTCKKRNSSSKYIVVKPYWQVAYKVKKGGVKRE